ncbi:MAG: SemiSWEET transporter [Rhodospirillales bacterium]|nr:SemiSWEET transporter [Rhodospirillales bacterium]
MDWVSILGFLAGGLTTLAFVPQVVKVWRTRSTADISLLTFLALCVGIVLWLVYGFLIGDLPLLIANGVTLFLAVNILVFKIRYK